MTADEAQAIAGVIEAARRGLELVQIEARVKALEKRIEA
jgi:hypothetical protein